MPVIVIPHEDESRSVIESDKSGRYVEFDIYPDGSRSAKREGDTTVREVVRTLSRPGDGSIRTFQGNSFDSLREEDVSTSALGLLQASRDKPLAMAPRR